MAFLCKVEICGVDTSKLPVLKNNQMVALFQQYQAGDEQARDQLIHCNLRLVLSVLQRFSNRNENADDLFQVGCIGLMKAIDNFDLSQNVRFSTYAVPMIICSREILHVLSVHTIFLVHVIVYFRSTVIVNG